MRVLCMISVVVVVAMVSNTASATWILYDTMDSTPHVGLEFDKYRVSDNSYAGTGGEYSYAMGGDSNGYGATSSIIVHEFVTSSYYTNPLSLPALLGTREWRWVWTGSPANGWEDYVWRFNVRGSIGPNVGVDLTSSSGYGSGIALGWVLLHAFNDQSSLFITNANGVIVGAEIINGIGRTAFCWSQGLGGLIPSNLVWSSGQSTLNISISKTAYIPLSTTSNQQAGQINILQCFVSSDADIGSYRGLQSECGIGGGGGVMTNGVGLYLRAPELP